MGSRLDTCHNAGYEGYIKSKTDAFENTYDNPCFKRQLVEMAVWNGTAYVKQQMTVLQVSGAQRHGVTLLALFLFCFAIVRALRH
jgi:hypothetical protein